MSWQFKIKQNHNVAWGTLAGLALPNCNRYHRWHNTMVEEDIDVTKMMEEEWYTWEIIRNERKKKTLRGVITTHPESSAPSWLDLWPVEETTQLGKTWRNASGCFGQWIMMWGWGGTDLGSWSTCRCVWGGRRISRWDRRCKHSKPRERGVIILRLNERVDILRGSCSNDVCYSVRHACARQNMLVKHTSLLKHSLVKVN